MSVIYVKEHNIDDRVIEHVKTILTQGKLICTLTESNWTVFADLHQKNALEKLHKLKDSNKFKHFSLFLHSLQQASDYAKVHDQAFKLMKRNIPGSFTFILEASKLSKKLIQASKTDAQVGLRFCPLPYFQELLKRIDRPLIGTNITPSLLGLNEDDFIYPQLIDDKLSHLIDTTLDPGIEVEFVETTIVNLIQDDEDLIVRQSQAELK